MVVRSMWLSKPNPIWEVNRVGKWHKGVRRQTKQKKYCLFSEWGQKDKNLQPHQLDQILFLFLHIYYLCGNSGFCAKLISVFYGTFLNFWPDDWKTFKFLSPTTIYVYADTINNMKASFRTKSVSLPIRSISSSLTSSLKMVALSSITKVQKESILHLGI